MSSALDPRPIPAFLPKFLLKAEACKLKSYLDSAGIWTIGVGHTGPEVTAGMVITMAMAETYLEADLRVARRKLYRVVTPEAIDRLGENQYAALLSFVFNVGTKPKWGIWKVVNDGKLEDVPSKMGQFTKARNPKTGKLETLKGLVHRRNAEIAMWNTADPLDVRKLANVPPPAVAVIEAAPAMELPSSGLIRLVDTPPASPPKNTMKTLWTGVGGGLAVAPAGIKQIADTVQGWNTGEGFVSQAYGMLMAVGAALAVAAMVYAWIDHRHSKNG